MTVNLSLKQIGLIAIALCVALFGAYSAGRWATPAKVKTEYVEKLVVDQKAINEAVAKAEAEWKKNEKVRVVEHDVYKDGVVVEHTKVTERETQEQGSTSSQTNTSSTTTTHTQQETTKKEERTAQTDRLRLGTTAGFVFDKPIALNIKDIDWAVHGQVRTIGGIWVGAEAIPQLKYYGLSVSFQW